MFDVGVLNTNLANALQSDKQTFEISDDSEQLVNFTKCKWKPTSHMEGPSQSQDLPQNTLSWFHGNQRLFPINMLLVNLWWWWWTHHKELHIIKLGVLYSTSSRLCRFIANLIIFCRGVINTHTTRNTAQQQWTIKAADDKFIRIAGNETKHTCSSFISWVSLSLTLGEEKEGTPLTAQLSYNVVDERQWVAIQFLSQCDLLWLKPRLLLARSQFNS